MSSSVQTHSISHVRFGTETNKSLTDVALQKCLALKIDEIIQRTGHTHGETLISANGAVSLFIDPIDTKQVNIWSSAPGPGKFPIYALIRSQNERFRISSIRRTLMGSLDRDVTAEDIQSLERLLKACLPA